jgi:ribonuclease HII
MTQRAEELVCGVDEAGRGPIAGPVTAAAVILPPGYPVGDLADSKALSPRRRLAAAETIRRMAVAWSVGWATHEEIDELNIHRATLLAMARAIRGLSVLPGRVLVDGLFCPDTGLPSTAIVKGDATVPEIMAASILAKTSRDAWMEGYARIEPAYGFEQHKGYPTAEHRALVLRIGPSRIHRRSFRVSSPCG